MTHIFPETPNVSPLSARSLKGLRPDLLHPYIHTYPMALRCPPDAFSTEYIDVATNSRHP